MRITFKHLPFWLLTIFVATNHGFAQKRVLIQTRKPVNELLLQNAGNGSVASLKPFNKEKTLFYIETSTPSEYSITSIQGTELHVVNLERKTNGKWITLKPNQSINLMLSTKDDPSKIPFWYKISGKLSAGLVYKGAVDTPKNQEKVFSSRHFEFLTPEEFSLRWSEKYLADSLYIHTENSNDCIWKMLNYQGNELNYSLLKQNLTHNFEQNLNYNLTFYGTFTEGNEKKKSQASFTFKSLIFETKNPAYFIVNDSLAINWRTFKKIEKIQIKELKSQNTIWEKTNFAANNIDYVGLKNEIANKIEAKKKYQLILEIKSQKDENELHILDFEILLPRSEYLKIMQFLNE